MIIGTQQGPQKPPTSIKFTQTQQLEMENLSLKIQMAQQEMQQLVAARAALVDKIAKEHDVDLKDWMIDAKAGTAFKPQVAPQIVQPIVQPAPSTTVV